MLFYFPQWQGSKMGQKMLTGASIVREYLDRSNITVSMTDNGSLSTKHHINAHDLLLEQLQNFKSSIIENRPETIETIGGDCGLEIIPVSYLAQNYDNFGVIWLDAHADFNLPDESPSKNFHGMPLRTLIGEGSEHFRSLLFTTIQPKDIHYLGLRAVDPLEQKRLAELEIYTGYQPSTEDLIKCLKSKGIKNLYIHFDVDCLDPREFMYSYYKVNDGLSINASVLYLKALKANFNIVGSSLLESVVTKKEELDPINNIIDQLFN